VSTIVFVALCLLLPHTTPTNGQELERNLLRDAGYHRAQAMKDRQEAARLDHAIQRYELMARIYQDGSDRSSGTVNPQGRRLMVQRTKRVIHYFAQQKHEHEQRAANHEALAQALPDR
jgi:hypothetical protein